MFHTYITASSGRRVDFDRASYLMDGELFGEAHRNLIKTMCCGDRFSPFDVAMYEQFHFPTIEAKANRVWRVYCRLHQEKYDCEFTPDVDPAWDQ